MTALLTLAKQLGIDPGPLNRMELQEQVCSAAIAQINELAAQAERLREYATPAIKLMRATGKLSGWHEKADLIESVISETPPAALAVLKAQWQAEAGRDGFIRGYFHSRKFGFLFEEELEAAANRYASHISNRAKEAGDE